ncbi:hypothetical protein GCM10028816_36080 [Spirosoma lituiforme]
MLKKFCEMVNMMHEKNALGRLQIAFKGGDEESLDIYLEYPDCQCFIIYSFCNLADIKASFDLVKKYILTGKRVPFYSSVEVRTHKTIDFHNYATDTPTE